MLISATFVSHIRYIVYIHYDLSGSLTLASLPILYQNTLDKLRPPESSRTPRLNMGFLDRMKPGKKVADVAEITPPTPLMPMASGMSTPRYARSVAAFEHDEVDDVVKRQMMADYIYGKICVHSWISNNDGVYQGVLVRNPDKTYTATPAALADSPFSKAATSLDLVTCMAITPMLMQQYIAQHPSASAIRLGQNLSIQILPSLEYLYKARKHQYAAYVLEEDLLIVWDDEPRELFARADALEKLYIDYHLGFMSLYDDSKNQSTLDVKTSALAVTTEVSSLDDYDHEAGAPAAGGRAVHLQNSILVALTLIIVTVMLGAGFREVAIEVAVDQSYIRVAFLLLTPVQIFFTLFFAQVVVGCLAQMFGPISQLHGNSKFFSAKTSPRLYGTQLPHVTIQCPVYKEGLEGVILPTVRSIKQCISTYEMQGGTANIFINDDGLQLIDETERQARIDFYEANNIGWVARPKHGENGFLRRGKFKKVCSYLISPHFNYTDALHRLPT